jgi:hypothetical protein
VDANTLDDRKLRRLVSDLRRIIRANERLNKTLGKGRTQVEAYHAIDKVIKHFASFLGAGTTTYLSRKVREGGLKVADDHVIPVNVFLKRLQDHTRSDAQVCEDFKQMLHLGVLLVSVTREESLLLNAELRNTMPEGWTPGDDPFERYRQAGVKVCRRPAKEIA